MITRWAFAFLSVCFYSQLLWAAPHPPSEYYNSLKAKAFSSKESMSERWSALQEMGRSDINWFKSDLEKALQSKEWFIRNAALISIQNGPREFVIHWSEKLLKDSALVVRTQAVKNLISFKARESSDLLYQELKSTKNFRGTYSLWIRPYLAQGLALNPPKDWMECYRYMLNDNDEKVQSWAVVGLEKKSGLQLGSKTDSMDLKKKKWLNYFGIRQI